MKFVHAADLHLDSPLRGLDRYEGAPVDAIRGATRRALSALVDLCLEEEADALFLAGDLYDGDWKDYNTGLFFAAQMARLREVGTEVVWVRGNHDAASIVAKSLRLPPWVHELGTKRAQTKELERAQIAVHGQGFAKREITQDLTEAYPAPVAGVLNVGLLHTSLDGRPGHATYAPCRAEALAGKGYAYWALGHVHAREVVREAPWVVFPGNLQGRHARETGPKGAMLVHYEGARIESVEPRTLDVVRWSSVEIDATGASTAGDVLELVRARLERERVDAADRTLAVRVRVAGRTKAHGAVAGDHARFVSDLRSLANEIDGLWIEKVAVDTRPASAGTAPSEAMRELLGELSGLEGAGDDELAAFVRELDELRVKLPEELRRAEDGPKLDDPAWVRARLAEVEALLVERLGAGGASGEEEAT
jgi:DNA repair exonuclease SbcCD nuclease subunit